MVPFFRYRLVFSFFTVFSGHDVCQCVPKRKVLICGEREGERESSFFSLSTSLLSSLFSLLLLLLFFLFTLPLSPFPSLLFLFPLPSHSSHTLLKKKPAMCGITALLLADQNQMASPELFEGLGMLQHRGQASSPFLLLLSTMFFSKDNNYDFNFNNKQDKQQCFNSLFRDLVSNQ